MVPNPIQELMSAEGRAELLSNDSNSMESTNYGGDDESKETNYDGEESTRGKELQSEDVPFFRSVRASGLRKGTVRNDNGDSESGDESQGDHDDEPLVVFVKAVVAADDNEETMVQQYDSLSDYDRKAQEFVNGLQAFSPICSEMFNTMKDEKPATTLKLTISGERFARPPSIVLRAFDEVNGTYMKELQIVPSAKQCWNAYEAKDFISLLSPIAADSSRFGISVGLKSCLIKGTMEDLASLLSEMGRLKEANCLSCKHLSMEKVSIQGQNLTAIISTQRPGHGRVRERSSVYVEDCSLSGDELSRLFRVLGDTWESHKVLLRRVHVSKKPASAPDAPTATPHVKSRKSIHFDLCSIHHHNEEWVAHILNREISGLTKVSIGGECEGFGAVCGRVAFGPLPSLNEFTWGELASIRAPLGHKLGPLLQAIPKHSPPLHATCRRNIVLPLFWENETGSVDVTQYAKLIQHALNDQRVSLFEISRGQYGDEPAAFQLAKIDGGESFALSLRLDGGRSDCLLDCFPALNPPNVEELKIVVVPAFHGTARVQLGDKIADVFSNDAGRWKIKKFSLKNEGRLLTSVGGDYCQIMATILREQPGLQELKFPLDRQSGAENLGAFLGTLQSHRWLQHFECSVPEGLALGVLVILKKNRVVESIIMDVQSTPDRSTFYRLVECMIDILADQNRTLRVACLKLPNAPKPRDWYSRTVTDALKQNASITRHHLVSESGWFQAGHDEMVNKVLTRNKLLAYLQRINGARKNISQLPRGLWPVVCERLGSCTNEGSPLYALFRDGFVLEDIPPTQVTPAGGDSEDESEDSENTSGESKESEYVENDFESIQDDSGSDTHSEEFEEEGELEKNDGGGAMVGNCWLAPRTTPGDIGSLVMVKMTVTVAAEHDLKRGGRNDVPTIGITQRVTMEFPPSDRARAALCAESLRSMSKIHDRVTNGRVHCDNKDKAKLSVEISGGGNFSGLEPVVVAFNKSNCSYMKTLKIIPDREANQHPAMNVVGLLSQVSEKASRCFLSIDAKNCPIRRKEERSQLRSKCNQFESAGVETVLQIPGGMDFTLGSFEARTQGSQG